MIFISKRDKNKMPPKSYICQKCQQTIYVQRLRPENKYCKSCVRSFEISSYLEIVKHFEERGCVLLTPEEDYINTNTKIEYKCKCGNLSTTTVGGFKTGTSYGCSNCYSYVKKGTTKEEIFNEFKNKCESEGITLITTIQNFNHQEKIKYICKNNHQSETNLRNFQEGARCEKCSVSAKRLDVKVISSFFEDHNCEWLDNEYKNNKQILNYRCKKCNSQYTVTYNNAKKPKFIPCHKCK